MNADERFDQQLRAALEWRADEAARRRATRRGWACGPSSGSAPGAGHHGSGTSLLSLSMSVFEGFAAIGQAWGVVEEMAEVSTAAYRALVYDDPEFADFFHAVTPVREVSRLQLGSRPAKRRGDGGIESLRAIPWVFSWTQSRIVLPAWYGPGHNPPLPVVISPHGRGATGRSNAAFFGRLPASGGFAVISPDGMGERLRNFSYGAPGQIDDLARMKTALETGIPARDAAGMAGAMQANEPAISERRNSSFSWLACALSWKDVCRSIVIAAIAVVANLIVSMVLEGLLPR